MNAGTIFGIIFNLILSIGIIPHYMGRVRKIGYFWSMMACLFLTPLIGVLITWASPKIRLLK